MNCGCKQLLCPIVKLIHGSEGGRDFYELHFLLVVSFFFFFFINFKANRCVCVYICCRYRWGLCSVTCTRNKRLYFQEKKSKKESLTSIYIHVWSQFSSLNNVDESIIQWSYTELAVVAHIVTIIFYFFCFLHRCNCLRQFCTMSCSGLVIHFPVFFLLAPSFCLLVFPCKRTKTESCVHQGLYHGSPDNVWKHYWL